MLDWPIEVARRPVEDELIWRQPGSNICLDFHGDPLRAQLVVFSDGNHHMALEECLNTFLKESPAITDIFYATTPPGVLVKLVQHGSLHLGNLCLSIYPHVFIGPEPVLDTLVESGVMEKYLPFMRSRGNVLLIRKGNPKHIRRIDDLLRDDVRLFISNPKTESASYRLYHDTILGLAAEADLDVAPMRAMLAGQGNRVIHGECIHHREAPQAIIENRADVALIYYHLALRYTRIFPEQFEFVPLGGTPGDVHLSSANLVTRYHIGLVNGGGKWGPLFIEFMLTNTVAAIYQKHGLKRSVQEPTITTD